MLLAVIVACEIAFWVLLIAGILARYPLRRPAFGAVLLASTPVVDLVLFVVTILDLRRGGSAGFVHGLAGAYIWFSIAFGHTTIRWVDQRYAHRFAGAPPPSKPPATGTRARLRYEWRGWLLGLAGWAVACGLLVGGVWVVGDVERSGQLLDWVFRLSLAMLIWLVGWPVWETVRVRRAGRSHGPVGKGTAARRASGGTAELALRALPFPLVASPGEAWRVDERTGAVTGSAASGTDIFVDPGNGTVPSAQPTVDAATLLGTPPEGDFQLGARVTVAFASTFDAGVLLLWVDEQHWGKLCFEYSPAGEPMVVSVVCRGVADDANAFVVSGASVWLRVSRIGRAYAYHASVDGQTWRLIRYFTLGDDLADHRIGFEAQSPTGEGCSVTFEQVCFARARLDDLRDGS